MDTLSTLWSVFHLFKGLRLKMSLNLLGKLEIVNVAMKNRSIPCLKKDSEICDIHDHVEFLDNVRVFASKKDDIGYFFKYKPRPNLNFLNHVCGT